MCAKAKKKRAAKKRKKKPAKKRAKKAAKKPAATKRKRYNSLGQHEILYGAWLAEGTIAGAVRHLQTIEGFESIDERTVKSIYKEKKGTEDDWDERAKTFYREIAERFDGQMVEEISRLKASALRKTLRGIEKLAAVTEKHLPKAAAKVLRDFTTGDLTGQERVYGFPKMLQALMAALRPPEKASAGTVYQDNRKQLMLSMQSPRELAQKRTAKELTLEVARRERAVEQESI